MLSQLRAPAVTFLAALAIAGCGGSAGDGGKLRVVATTTQIGDFARNVGGDRISLTVLLKPNQDAHDFEPQPSQIKDLARAALVLRNGAGLDTYVNKAVSTSGSHATVVIVSDGVAFRRGDEGESGGGAAASAEAAGRDPHVWTAVANAQRMVMNIRDAFVAADQSNAAVYEDNAKRYLARLDELEANIRSQIASIPSGCRKLVTNHDVLGYYAEAYGFKFAGSVIPSLSTNAAPSANDIAEIVRKIRDERVPAIFAEASVNPALIRQVGREAGVRVIDDLYGDSLGPSGSDGATYVGMMDSNTRKIVQALQACSA
jgi:ABC-type Zn uptake system ZnuABC Zn-binding protein ZnuA